MLGGLGVYSSFVSSILEADLTGKKLLFAETKKL